MESKHRRDELGKGQPMKDLSIFYMKNIKKGKKKIEEGNSVKKRSGTENRVLKGAPVSFAKNDWNFPSVCKQINQTKKTSLRSTHEDLHDVEAAP